MNAIRRRNAREEAAQHYGHGHYATSPNASLSGAAFLGYKHPPHSPTAVLVNMSDDDDDTQDDTLVGVRKQTSDDADAECRGGDSQSSLLAADGVMLIDAPTHLSTSFHDVYKGELDLLSPSSQADSTTKSPSDFVNAVVELMSLSTTTSPLLDLVTINAAAAPSYGVFETNLSQHIVMEAKSGMPPSTSTPRSVTPLLHHSMEPQQHNIEEEASSLSKRRTHKEAGLPDAEDVSNDVDDGRHVLVSSRKRPRSFAPSFGAMPSIVELVEEHAATTEDVLSLQLAPLSLGRVLHCEHQVIRDSSVVRLDTHASVPSFATCRPIRESSGDAVVSSSSTATTASLEQLFGERPTSIDQSGWMRRKALIMKEEAAKVSSTASSGILATLQETVMDRWIRGMVRHHVRQFLYDQAVGLYASHMKEISACLVSYMTLDDIQQARRSVSKYVKTPGWLALMDIRLTAIGIYSTPCTSTDDQLSALQTALAIQWWHTWVEDLMKRPLVMTPQYDDSHIGNTMNHRFGYQASESSRHLIGRDMESITGEWLISALGANTPSSDLIDSTPRMVSNDGKEEEEVHPMMYYVTLPRDDCGSASSANDGIFVSTMGIMLNERAYNAVVKTWASNQLSASSLGVSDSALMEDELLTSLCEPVTHVLPKLVGLIVPKCDGENDIAASAFAWMEIVTRLHRTTATQDGGGWVNVSSSRDDDFLCFRSSPLHARLGSLLWSNDDAASFTSDVFAASPSYSDEDRQLCRLTICVLTPSVSN